MENIKSSIKDSVPVFLCIFFVLVCLSLFSCKTSSSVSREKDSDTHTEFYGSSYSSENITVEDFISRFSVISVSGGVSRKITVFDTSRSVMTDSGFSSPVLAVITENDSSAFFSSEKDTATIRSEAVTHAEDNKAGESTSHEYEKDTVRVSTGVPFWLSLAALTIVVFMVRKLN